MHIDNRMRAWWKGLPERGRVKASNRLGVVLAWEEWKRKDRGPIEAFVLGWNERHPERRVSQGSVRRWARSYREDGVAGLVPRQYRGDFGVPDIPEELVVFFDRLYLDENRLTVAMCHRLTREHAAKLGLKCPSLSTFHRHVQELPEATVAIARMGEKYWEDRYGPFIVRDYDKLESNDVWVADHHQFDLVCTDERGRPCRPWLTAWMDVKSGKFVGCHISTRPDSTTIHLSFRRGALRHGVPYHWVIDNGKDFRHQDLAGGRVKKVRVEVDENYTRALVDRLGVTAHFSLPFNARAKLIERMFKEVKEGFSKTWRTYCGGKPDERPQRMRRELKRIDGLPTIQEVADAFEKWVAQVHDQEPCGRNGEARVVAYQRHLRRVRTAAEDSLVLMLMRTTKPVKVSRNGVRLYGQWYEADELLMAHGKKVFLRYDPGDLRKVQVFDLQDRWICEASALKALPYFSTEEEVKEGMARKRRARRAHKAYLDWLKEELDFPDVRSLELERGRRMARANQEELDEIPAPVIQPIEMERAFRAMVDSPPASNDWGDDEEEELSDRDRLALEALRSLRRLRLKESSEGRSA